MPWDERTISALLITGATSPVSTLRQTTGCRLAFAGEGGGTCGGIVDDCGGGGGGWSCCHCVCARGEKGGGVDVMDLLGRVWSVALFASVSLTRESQLTSVGFETSEGRPGIPGTMVGYVSHEMELEGRGYRRDRRSRPPVPLEQLHREGLAIEQRGPSVANRIQRAYRSQDMPDEHRFYAAVIESLDSTQHQRNRKARTPPMFLPLAQAIHRRLGS